MYYMIIKLKREHGGGILKLLDKNLESCFSRQVERSTHPHYLVFLNLRKIIFLINIIFLMLSIPQNSLIFDLILSFKNILIKNGLKK